METTTGGDHPTDFIPRDLVRPDGLRLDTFSDSPTDSVGPRWAVPAGLEPATTHSVWSAKTTRPVGHPLTHLSPVSLHQWDDTWMPSSGDLQSPTMPPANHFDRPRQSTSPGGRTWARLQRHTLDHDASCTRAPALLQGRKTNQIQSFSISPPPI